MMISCFFVSLLVFGQLTFDNISRSDIELYNKDKHELLIKKTIQEANRRMLSDGIKSLIDNSAKQWRGMLYVNDKVIEGIDDNYYRSQLVRYKETLQNTPYIESVTMGHSGEFKGNDGTIVSVTDEASIVEIKHLGQVEYAALTNIDLGVGVGANVPKDFYKGKIWIRARTVKKDGFPLYILIYAEGISTEVKNNIDLFNFGKNLTNLDNSVKIASRVFQREDKRMEATREWKDKTGKYSVIAEFYGMIGTTVKLKKDSGEIIEVDVSHLSDEDVEWIKSR